MTRLLASSLLAVLVASTAPAAAPEVREFRIQKVGDTTYFHLKLATPRNMLSDTESRNRWSIWSTVDPVLEPRLVPADDKARHVYQRHDLQGRAFPAAGPRDDRKPGEVQPPPMPRNPVPVDGLEFVGKAQGTDELKLTLIYPRESRLGRILPGSRRGRAEHVRWEEASLTLDVSKAKEVALPAEAKERREGAKPKKSAEHPVRDD